MTAHVTERACPALVGRRATMSRYVEPEHGYTERFLALVENCRMERQEGFEIDDGYGDVIRDRKKEEM